jgi:hypothetical protein
VEDVTLAQHRQSLCGGFADVYQGFRNSELVAVKKMRSIGGDQAAYKVCQFSLANHKCTYLIEILVLMPRGTCMATSQASKCSSAHRPEPRSLPLGRFPLSHISMDAARDAEGLHFNTPL